MMNTPEVTAWYKQFWPWLIIFFPASAVVAGTITVIIAVQNSDTLVKDNWYKDGLAINQELDKQIAAKRMGIAAHITINRENSQLILSLDNIDPANIRTINVVLVHPTQPEKDAQYQAFFTPTGNYVTQLPAIPAGFFHLRIDADNTEWQLTGGINFSNTESATIQPK